MSKLSTGGCELPLWSPKASFPQGQFRIDVDKLHGWKLLANGALNMVDSFHQVFRTFRWVVFEIDGNEHILRPKVHGVGSPHGLEFVITHRKLAYCVIDLRFYGAP